jgi:2,3-bisphosphoglycerate-independent phosphoglycerate mutase
MKYVILIGDGMADYPLDILGGKTPLEYAHTPNLNRMAAEGIDTIPQGLPPGSDVANLAVLGYSPQEYYTGRGPLEAANIGVSLSPEDVAFRCNLVTISHGNESVMEDFTAGHISTIEAKVLMSDLEKALGSENFHFYPGVGYRHLMVWKGGDAKLEATPPHDITGKAIKTYLPQGPGADQINQLMLASRDLLSNHAVNLVRRAQGLRPANSIWLWGQGRAPRMQKLKDRFHVSGAMISAVDLLNGIGIYAGLEILPVEGATGYIDTNYLGKAERALSALKEFDLVFVHVEAPDEMGHEGNVQGKIRAIEDFDEKVVGTILKGIAQASMGRYRMAVLSDHPTPISLKTHVADPSPFSVLSYHRDENEQRGFAFGEREASRTGNMISPGHLLMEIIISNWRQFLGKKPN